MYIALNGEAATRLQGQELQTRNKQMRAIFGERVLGR